jgi:hypothetical protein
MRNIRLISGICGALAFAAIAFSQTPPQAPTSLQAHVVFSIPEPDLTVKIRSYEVPVTMDSSGEFTVKDLRPAIIPAECDPAGATAPEVGIEVTGTVNLTPDARYQVRLTVRSRWIAGCRDVGGLTIPVFGNIILSNDAVVVVIGEVLPIMIRDDSRVAPIKVEVILMEEK